MAEIATDLYTGSDHETLYWEIGKLDGGTDNNHKAIIIGWKIQQPVKNDDIDEEEEWRHKWKPRIYSYRGLDNDCIKRSV
jgi:hypothetical protein